LDAKRAKRARAICSPGYSSRAHFLEQWVLTPHDRTMPEARVRLTDLAVRAPESE
jgi:hypothetical protein